MQVQRTAFLAQARSMTASTAESRLKNRLRLQNLRLYVFEPENYLGIVVCQPD